MGEALLEVEVAGEEQAERGADGEADVPAAASSQEPQAGARGQAGAAPTLASPAVRRVAREHGLDLALVHGSGPDGRILKGACCRPTLFTVAGQPG